MSRRSFPTIVASIVCVVGLGACSHPLDSPVMTLNEPIGEVGEPVRSAINPRKLRGPRRPLVLTSHALDWESLPVLAPVDFTLEVDELASFTIERLGSSGGALQMSRELVAEIEIGDEVATTKRFYRQSDGVTAK